MNFKRPSQTIVMAITPTMAEEMLATSIGNRNLRKGYVKELTDAITRGEWRLTNQGIGFDVNGNLRDGHHRLTAVVRSKRAIQTNVTFGMPVSAYEVIDCGASRSYSDRTGLSIPVAEGLRLAAFLAFGYQRPSVNQIRLVAETGLQQIIAEMISFCGTKTKIICSANFRLSAAITVLDGGDRTYVFNQYRALSLGNFEEQSSISLALEKMIKRGKIIAATGPYQQRIMAIGLKVFNKKNANLKSFRITEDEERSAWGIAASIINDHLSA
jgi:hypothetical protein